MTRKCQHDKNGMPCSNDAGVIGEDGDAWCTWHLRLCSSFRGGTWTGRETWIHSQGHKPGKEAMSNGYGMSAGLSKPGPFEAQETPRIMRDPVSAQPKQAQIPQALRELGEAVERMDKEFEMLSDKLAPITRCPSLENSVCGGGDPAEIPSVELASIINAATERINNIQCDMRSVGERIEL